MKVYEYGGRRGVVGSHPDERIGVAVWCFILMVLY